MRRFLIVGHRAASTPDFSLDDLPGTGGRIDILLSGVNAALLLSHGIRRDTEAITVHLGPRDPPACLRFSGAAIERWNPDLRSNASLVRAVLGDIGLLDREVRPGIHASKRSFEDAVRARRGPVFHLVEGGDDVRDVDLPADALYVLSDHVELTADEATVLKSVGAMRMTVGPRALQAYQVIAILHNELDRREAARTTSRPTLQTR